MSKVISYSIVLDEYPKTCDECPFLSRRRYQCHNERGIVYDCLLGFMLGCDTRDYPVEQRRFTECHIEECVMVPRRVFRKWKSGSDDVHLDLTDPTDIIKPVRIDRDDEEKKRCCYVEYNGKKKALCYPDEYFKSRSDNDLMYLTRSYFRKHLDMFD